MSTVLSTSEKSEWLINIKLQQQSISWKYSFLAEDNMSWGKTDDVPGSHPSSDTLSISKLQAYGWKIVYKVYDL